MKKILSIILILASLTSVYPVSLHTSIGVKSTPIETPIYAEFELTEVFENFELFAIYQIGHDIVNSSAYNSINFGSTLYFDWGKITLKKKFGNNVNETEFRLEF